MPEKAPTMASSSYDALNTSTTNNPTNLSDSWDPQIIAAGGQPSSVGMIDVSPHSRTYREQQRRKTFGKRGTQQQGQHRHITSEAAGGASGNDVHAQAALRAAEGGPAAPSAQVGVEVSPSKSRDYDDHTKDDDDDSLTDLRAATGSAEEAEAAERAFREHELQSETNPVLACVDQAGVLFREKMNCEYFEERQPSPRKAGGALDTSLASVGSYGTAGGRVVTVGGQTTVTQPKPLSPPSKRGGVRDIIQESTAMADRPSPHSARKSQAFFSQFDVSDVKSSSTDAGDTEGGEKENENTRGQYNDDDDDDMPDDELNESRSRSRANSAVGTARDGPSPSNDDGGAVPPPPAADGREVTVEEGEEDIITSITRTLSDMCAGAGAAAAGAGAAVGAAMSPSSSGAAKEEGGGDAQEEADMPPNEAGLDVDICTYLQNICGVQVLGGESEPPPPPPPPPTARDGSPSSPSRSPGSGVRAIAIGGGAAAAAATAASRNHRDNHHDDHDDEQGLSTSMNGKAAQLDLSGTRGGRGGRGGGGTDQQENTAIEVEYVDPDYYTSDEDDDEDYEYNHRGAAAAGGAAGAAAAARKAKSKKDKKKKGGLGKGLSKMFGGKSKGKKVDPHDADEEKKDDVDPARIAATAAAAAAAAGTAAALAAQGDEAGTLTDEDESQGTADHVGGAEAEVVRAPEAGEEPGPSGSEGWTVDEKNAHLQSMASKARDDYMYGKGSPPPSPGRGAAVADGTPDDSSVPEDDYADWRPSEKRRFLQLLSQGMSPREAARVIKNARRGIEPGDLASPSAEAAEAAGAAEIPEEEQVVEAVDDSEVVDDKAGDDDDEEPVEQDDDDGSPMAAAAVAAGATAVTAAGVAAILNKTAEDEEAPANVLGETGVGYYDGVERDGDDAAAENVVDISAVQAPKPPQDAASVKPNKRTILPVSLKSKGFSSLDSDMNSPDDRRKRGNIKGLFAGGKNKATKDGFATLDSDSENELEENFEGERSVAASKATGANDDDTIFDFKDDKTVEAGGVRASASRSPQPDVIPEDNAEPLPSSEMSVVSGVTMNTEYTDNMTVGTAYTNASTKSTRRRHRGAAKKRLNKAKEAEDGKSVGWLDSIRAAAANNNRVWDPQRGWVDYEEPEKGDDGSSTNHIGPLHLPVKARDAQYSDDQGPRGVDPNDSGLRSIEEDDVTEMAGTTSRAAYGAAAVGATAAAATAAVASNVANSQGQQDDGTVTSALTENTSRSAVSDRRGAPKGWVESMKAASERVSASDPNRRWDPQHGWIGLPPGTMPPAEDEEENVQTQEANNVGQGVALNTGMISERSAGPVVLDDSDIDDDDDDEESVEVEQKDPQGLPEEPPEEEPIVSRRLRPDPSGVHDDSEDATLASGMSSSDVAEPASDSGAKKPFIKLAAPRMGRGRGAAQKGYDELASVASENRPRSTETGEQDVGIVKTSSQTSYEQFDWDESNASGAPVAAAAAVGAAAAVAASSLPPKVPKKDRPDSAEKSAPEVQVVKLKVNDKDKNLFLNKDDSAHFIDDTNFAPEFADESPFSTPSRTAATARGGIEASGDGIGLDTTQSDIMRSSPKSDAVESDAGIVSSKTSRDPPQNVAEGVDGASATPSVSSRAKQWMELMESKSKKNVAPGGASDTKSEASSAIDWPGGSVSSNRKAQSKGGEEFKSFLGKKGASASSQQRGRTGNALKFAAADGGSEANFKSDTGAPSTARGGLARAPTDDEDTLFKFDEHSQMTGGTNPLKAKLKSMNAARGMQDVSEASETTVSSEDEPSSTGGDAKGGKKSIFKRLTECASPILPEGCANPTIVDDTGKEVPVSHLEFLKKSKVAGSLREIAPSTLCGRPDTIYEEDRDGRRRSTKKSASTSSVASGSGFGAKNAYLDAVALKTATRGRSSSTGRPSSRGRSSSSQRSERSSESWQGFLERRSASKSPGPSRPPTSPPAANVSAEQKAAQKVEEMMKAMAINTKSKADIDDMIETMSQSSSPSKTPTATGYDQIEMTRSNISSFSQNKKKSESAIAAEELAAARVEAMMKAMSSQKLDSDV